MENKLEKTMYESIDREELYEIYKKSEVFIHQRNSENEDAMFMKVYYYPYNAIAGYTDYKDHRKDTIEKIKELIEEEIKEAYLCQRGSFLNYNGVPFDQISVTLSDCGWSAYPCWKDGSTDYFTENRRLATIKFQEFLEKKNGLKARKPRKQIK